MRRLIEPLSPGAPNFDPRCFMSAPLCWLTDRETCEGFKTAVRWRFGLVQATGRYPGHEHQLLAPGLTASAGAAIAVDRQRFLELGGFDPLYLPGRIEDLDFAYRGYQAGYVAHYGAQRRLLSRGHGDFRRRFRPAGLRCARAKEHAVISMEESSTSAASARSNRRALRAAGLGGGQRRRCPRTETANEALASLDRGLVAAEGTPRRSAAGYRSPPRACVLPAVSSARKWPRLRCSLAASDGQSRARALVASAESSANPLVRMSTGSETSSSSLAGVN